MDAPSKDKSPGVIEKQIIEYYEQGYSQKDIHGVLKISVPRIRTVLKKNGYLTDRYRAVSSETKDIMEVLVYHEYSYRLISMLLDMSFHVVRELPETRDLRISNMERFPLNVPLNQDKYSQFLEEYEEGFSFLELYKDFSLGLQDVSPLADKILKNEDVMKKHKEGLEERALSMLKDGYPVHMVAKQLRVAVAIVKKLNQQMSKQ